MLVQVMCAAAALVVAGSVGGGTPQDPTTLAYVGRDPDGSFSGYVEDVAGHRVIEEGGSWQSVDDALAWARTRAARVILTYGFTGGTVFSAGLEYEPGTAAHALPEWPPIDAIVRAIDSEVAAKVNDYRQSQSPSHKLGIAEPEER
jgi:hypothetical protein